jgi:uncharacterized protein (TIGR02099 family)
MTRHIFNFAHHFLLWTLLLIAVSFLGINFLFSQIENYKTDLAYKLSEVIEAPVTIGKLNAKLRGIQPELQLSQLNIAAEKIQLKEIHLGIDAWQFLSTQNLLAATSITLVGAQITLIRHDDDSISLEGLKASEGEPLWLLQGRKYLILQSSITWRDEKLNKSARKIAPVNLAILNDGETHRINLLAQLQKTEPLRVSMEFIGNPFEPKTLNGKFFFESNNLKLKEFAEVDFPLGLKISDGTANLKAWAKLESGQFQTLNGELKLQNVVLNRTQHSNFKLDEFNSHFQFKHQNGTWQIALPSFQLQLPETELNGSISTILHENNPDQNSIGIFLAKVEIAPLISLANFFTDAPIENHTSGTVKNLSLFTQPTQQKFAADGEFDDLKINVANLNIEHLNGNFHGNEQVGTLFVNSEKLAFHAPTLFREVLPEIKLETFLNWEQTPAAWHICSEKIVLNNRDIPSESVLKLTLPKNGAAFMDLQTQFEIHDATQVWRYLPVGIMDKDIVSWLDKAFEKGRVKNGQFLFYGLLKDFPFEKGQGVFEVLFDGEDARLNYAPDWLPLDNLTAQVHFYQNSLQVNLSGMAQNAMLKSADITIPSMSMSNYVGIVGEAEGEISQVLGFMQRTPLKSRVDSVLTAISPQGKTNVLLDLQISLIEKLTSKVKGSAKFQNAKLKVKSLDLPVQAMNGTLQFTENGVFSETINAVALNRPIQIRLQSNDTQTTVHVVGSTGVDDLFEQLQILPLTQLNSQTKWIEGGSDYDLTLNLPYGKTLPTLQIQSMLAGISLNLPAELAKSKLQKVPLSMTLTLGDETFLPLSLNYNERLKAAVNIDTKNKKLERGAILLGDGKVDLPDSQGLNLKISRNDLVLQDWLGLAIASSENNAADIHTVSINSQNARWQKAELGEFDLLLKHENEGWHGDLKNEFAAGKLQFQKNTTLKFELEKLDLVFFKQLQSRDETKVENIQTLGESTKKLPSFLLQSEKTFWHDKSLGKLTIETEQSTNGMTIKIVDLQATTHHLSMTGEWKNTQTQLNGKMEFFKAGQLFSNLGITKDIAETTGNAKLDLHWQGSPQQFDLEKLRGDIDLNLQNGRILSIEPGFGRILGVLALDQWIKRLQLDFSDVYSEGLTFNSINGHFDISQGKVSTQDLTVDAIPAKILLKGDTDFIHENVDYLADVTPKSADAVPIAGTIVGKIMSLVGKTLTGKDQDGFFFGSQYSVKGSWGNIEVIPIYENEGLVQKTWHGITEFPWLNQKLNSKEAYHHD